MKQLIEKYATLRGEIWSSDVPPQLESPTALEVSSACGAFPLSATEYFEFLLLVGQDAPDVRFNWLPPFELSALACVKSSGAGMVGFWQQLDQLETGYIDSSPANAVKTDRSWRDNWLLIGQYDSDQLILDLDPGPSGVPGQILIQQMHTMNVLANSISDLFNWLVCSIEKNCDSFKETETFFPHELPGYYDQPLKPAG